MSIKVHLKIDILKGFLLIFLSGQKVILKSLVSCVHEVVVVRAGVPCFVLNLHPQEDSNNFNLCLAHVYVYMCPC